MSLKNSLVRIKKDTDLKIENFRHRLNGREFVHFLHIGKTGGSAIRDAIKSTLITDHYKIFLHGHSFTLRDVPLGEKVFFFVRDPIHRYASGFYSRLRQGKPRYNNPWRPQEKIAFESFKTPQELASALSSDDDERQIAAKFAMQNIGHVKSFYWRWFESEDYFLSRQNDIIFIGFQETLNQDFETLKKNLDLPKEVQLPNDSARSHRSPASQAVNFSPIERANLLQWYAKDYEFLDLCKSLSRQNRWN